MKLAVIFCTLFVAVRGGGMSARGYSGGGGGGSYGGGAGDGMSSGGYGGGAGTSYGSGSSAADALKNSYNVMDGYNINFGYNINDPVTYNRQSRKESGNPKQQVTGSYSLQEPDGTMRIVNYVADWKNGFTATVTDKDGTRTYGQTSGYGDDSEEGYGGMSGGSGGYGGMSGGSGGYGGMNGGSGGYGGMAGGTGGVSSGY